MVSSGVPTRPKRRLDAVRRPQILATAVQLVREKGLWSVRVSDVARRAGISPTSVLYYFGTKDELFAAAITGADDAFYDMVLVKLEALPTAHERIACLIAHSSVTDWILWMDLWVYTRHHPDTAVAQKHFSDRWRQTFEDVILHGVKTREWQVADAHEAALRLAAVTDGLAVHMVLGDPEYTRETYVRMSLTAVCNELGCELERLEREAAGCSLPPAAEQAS